MNTIQKIKNVQELRFSEIDKLFRKMGYNFTNGSGNSTVKVKLKHSVLTLHCNRKTTLKHGVVRTIKNQLIAEGII